MSRLSRCDTPGAALRSNRVIASAIIVSALAASASAAVRADPTVALYRAMLKDYRKYAETLWHAAPDQPTMGYWGTGRSDWNNEGIRAVSNTALAYAYLNREGDTAESVRDRVEPALRWCAATHLTGNAVCTDGKRWGNSWQSAAWAANMGVAASLARDTLHPETLVAVKRVVAYEADRFIGVSPPDMEPGDTKAEENAWNLSVAASALLLMPAHAHAVQWRDIVLRWGFNTIPCAADRASNEMLDGRPVREWVSTTQVLPDFTLENHGIFHPVYAMVGPATNAQSAVMFRLAGKPVPAALKFNVLKGWGMLQYIVAADGEWLYPQGLDWDLHDYEHIHYFTMLATLFKRPEAALLEQRLARYSRRRQVLNGDGRFVGASGNLGFAREAVQAERTVYCALMHEVFGAPPKATGADFTRMAGHVAPAKAFEGAGFVVHRSARGLTSFSWNHQLMGLAQPASERGLDRPYVTTPWQGSLVGRFTIEGQDARAGGVFKVLSHNVRTDKRGFAVNLDTEINRGALRQQIAVTSVAPGLLAYVDRVTALKDVVVIEERGLPISIENDEVSGNSRTVATSAGKVIVKAGSDRDLGLHGRWANVDSRLGLVSLIGAMVYRAAGKPNRPGAREDYLLGAHNGQRRSFHAGETVAERAGLVLLDGTVAETEALARSASLARVGNRLSISFTAPDGTKHALDLAPSRGDTRVEQREAEFDRRAGHQPAKLPPRLPPIRASPVVASAISFPGPRTRSSGRWPSRKHTR